ncbi:MAG: M16 family metallopeptidase [Planctomycetota bacterium]
MIPQHRELQLDNGLRAVFVERRGLPVVATALFYRVGSRDERTGESGVAHFLEHMMFKGTSRYAKGEIDLVTSKLGGSNNAYTDHDSTAYHFSLAADRWETALEIEASRMRDCLLDPKEFESEKQVVLEELAMGQDEPWNRLFTATESLAFDVHPYHRPIIGYREDLERLTVDGMRDFYQRHYAPDRAFLVVVGDIDAKSAAKTTKSLFGDLPRGNGRPEVLAEPEFRGERRGVVRTPGPLCRISLACRSARVGEHDDFVLDILAQVLAAAKSSRLHRRLVVEQELATQVHAGNETRLDPGLFTVAVELRPGVDPEQVEAIVREEIETLRQDGVTAAELKRARIQIRSAFLFEDETALESAIRIGRYEALSPRGWKLLGDILPTYDSIDRRVVREVAMRVFAQERWTTVYGVPDDYRIPRPSVRRKSSRARKSRTARKKS